MQTLIQESTFPLTELRSALRRNEQSEIDTHILEAVKGRQECDLEELVRLCSSYTWNQIFSEVDRMSRSGELRLMPIGFGRYIVSLPLHTACLMQEGSSQIPHSGS